MRTVWTILNLVVWTIIIGVICLIVSIFERRGKIIAKLARLWAKIILTTAGVKYIVKGLDNLDPQGNYIFAGNHESAFDIPLAFAGIPLQLVSISKIELKQIPIFGWAMQAAKHIFVDRKNHRAAIKSLETASISLQENPRSVLLFPEGTRSKDGIIHKFKKGGLFLAIQAQMAVVPMALCGTRDVAVKGAKKFNPTPVELRIGTPIIIEGMTYDDRDKLVEKVYNEVVRMKQEWASA